MFAASKHNPSFALSRAKAHLYIDKNRYRFRFNGKELDKEGMGGGGSTYDYGFRIYNPQLGKFLSVDPLFKNFSFWTPFQFASNNPIVAIDLDGLEAVVVITGITKGKGEASVWRGQYFMHQVNIYENMTIDEYNEAFKSGTLKAPDATTLLARDAWSGNSRSKARFGKSNETPPGEYFLTYNPDGYGSKKYRLKVSETKNGDYINGPDGQRSGIRIHRWSPWGAVGCFTTGSNNISSEDDFIDLIPSLKENLDVKLIVQPRTAEYNETNNKWEGTESVTPKPTLDLELNLIDTIPKSV